MKILKWILHEMRLQWKNGLYAVYILIAFLYVFALGYVPEDYKEAVSIMLVVTDPTFVGLMFVGALLLLEKNQGIPKGIGVSPLGEAGYIWGKVCSLLVISLCTSVCLLWAGKVNISLHQILGILLSAGIFTLMGIIVGSGVKDINQFLIWSTAICIPLGVPLVAFYLGDFGNWLSIIPTYALLHLMHMKTVGISMLIDFASLVIWAVVMYYLAKNRVREYIFVR